jgi:hypothetical protein
VADARPLGANPLHAAPYGGARWIPDNSALSCFRESPETFRLKYRLHLQSASPDDKMRAGSAIHAARNVLYDYRVQHQRMGLESFGYPDDIVLRAVAVGRKHRGEGPGHRGAEQVEAVVRTYAVKYGVEPFAVVENEKYVQARIHTNTCYVSANLAGDVRDACIDDGCFDFCGIQDAVIRFSDGSEYVMDTKSTGAYLGEAWETAMRLGDQFVGYVAMRRALGLRCDGFFVDGIHMKDAKPRKDGSLGVPSVTEDDFARIGPVGVPDWRVERWAADVRYTLAAIAELERTRGIAVPWPAYQNWPYGKVDAYREFYETPPELHASVAQQFEKRPWSPQAVADERKVAQT